MPSVIYKSAWIPITERLPEKSGTYLVTIPCKTFKVPRYYITKTAYYLKRENQWTPDDEWEEGKVIAWMPLPEPYNAESEVEE